MSDTKGISTIAWFEIPAADLGRATAFYESVLAKKLIADPQFPGMSIFPYERPGISGCVMTNDARPTGDGTLIYLNANGQLDQVLGRVGGAGGKILKPKEELPAGIGWIATIEDTEGNRIGLHSAI